MTYHWDWHKENPDIGDEVENVGKVGERRDVQAFSRDSQIPICLQRPTYEAEGHRNANAPREHQCCSRDDDVAEYGDNEDAVVEAEDAEFDADKRNVVEVTKYVIALGDVSISSSILARWSGCAPVLLLLGLHLRRK